MENRRPPIPRARCPCFKALADYKGRQYIYCDGQHHRCRDGSARESQYRARCCGDYEQCELYKGRKQP